MFSSVDFNILLFIAFSPSKSKALPKEKVASNFLFLFISWITDFIFSSLSCVLYSQVGREKIHPKNMKSFLLSFFAAAVHIQLIDFHFGNCSWIIFKTLFPSLFDSNMFLFACEFSEFSLNILTKVAYRNVTF